MLVLCDGGAEAIWRTEELDTVDIVNMRVLGREGEILITDVDNEEDTTEGMEAF